MNRWMRVPLVAVVWLGLLAAGEVCAYTLWTENAENGTAYVIDNTSPSYPLIQSDVVGQGSYAFHLAQPSLQDNSFVIDQTLTMQPDTKLFFLSRLRYATTTQIARVQISTDGGNTWPTNIYNQAGSNDSGEGAFSLRTVDLGGYSAQSLRFRFYYDYTGGSGYPQIDSAVGWFVDDIQIGSEFAKIPWAIGNPSPHAQLYLEYVNRARADALVEATRLANESDQDIQDAYNYFNVTGQNIVNQFTWYVNNGVMDRYAQPLSFQADLLTAAELHSQDMFQNEFQGHYSSANPPAPFQPGDDPVQRLTAVGYDYTTLGENVYSYADSVAHGHAGFDVDWGNTSNPADPAYNPSFVGQGMQNPAGHRISIHNNSFKEIGIGVVNGTNGSVGPQVVTQDFGSSGDVRYVTGVVYEDLNANNFYDVGEGRPGVRIDVDGSAYYALSSTSGGYSVPVPQDGSYQVTFSGGGFQSFLTSAVVAGGRSVKVDYLVQWQLLLAGDYNGNGVVDAADYTVWRNTLNQTGSNLAADGNGDNLVDAADYAFWKARFGNTTGAGAIASGPAGASVAAVPEPATAALLAVALLAACAARRRERILPGHSSARPYC